MFCKEQEKKNVRFSSMHNNCNPQEKQRRFNEKFEIEKKQKSNSFDKGYGNLMSDSEYAKGKLSYDRDNINKKHKHVFHNIDNKALTIYKEPQSFLQSYGNHERFDVKKVKDFTYNTGGLHMSDYSNAFKMIGEKNVKKVKIERRTYKSYLRQRALEQQSYKISNNSVNEPSTEESSIEETTETSSDGID